jgi:hypothetical protein
MGTPKNSTLHLIITINPVLLVLYIINARHQVQLSCFFAGGLTFCFAIDHADNGYSVIRGFFSQKRPAMLFRSLGNKN